MKITKKCYNFCGNFIIILMKQFPNGPSYSNIPHVYVQLLTPQLTCLLQLQANQPQTNSLLMSSVVFPAQHGENATLGWLGGLDTV